MGFKSVVYSYCLLQKNIFDKKHINKYILSSPNVYGLYVGRFVGGVAVGAFSVSIPPYIEDIAEKELLPSLTNFYHVHFACGVLFGYIIGMFLEYLHLQYLRIMTHNLHQCGKQGLFYSDR